MKKLLALILVLGMMFSLTACRSTSDDDDDDSKPSKSTSDKKDDNEDEEVVVVVEDDETNSDLNESSRVERPLDDEDDDADISRGTVSGNTYRNSYSGIKFTKPSSWEFKSDDEILELLGASIDDIDEMLESGLAIYDAIATSSSGTSVIIGFENLEATGSEDYTAEDYTDAVTSQLEAAGYDIGSSKEIDLCGDEYLKTIATLEYSGVEVCQAYYVRKVDNYIAFVIVSTVDSSELSDIEDMFS